jgi:hypothetical protein
METFECVLVGDSLASAQLPHHQHHQCHLLYCCRCCCHYCHAHEVVEVKAKFSSLLHFQLLFLFLSPPPPLPPSQCWRIHRRYRTRHYGVQRARRAHGTHVCWVAVAHQASVELCAGSATKQINVEYYSYWNHQHFSHG